MQAIWSLEVCEPEATSFLGFLSPYFNSWKPGVSVTSPTQASAFFHSPLSLVFVYLAVSSAEDTQE